MIGADACIVRRQAMRKKLKLLMNNCTKTRHGFGREEGKEAGGVLFGSSGINRGVEV